MMRTLLAAVAMLALAGTAHAQRYSGVDGTRLLGICTSRDARVRSSCESYVAGVSDTITLFQQMAPASGGKLTVPKAVCVPPGTKGSALAEAVVTWLRSHPADGKRPAVAVVDRVLRQQYGCK